MIIQYEYFGRGEVDDDKADKDVEDMALSQGVGLPPVSPEQKHKRGNAEKVPDGSEQEVTGKHLRIGPVNVPPAIIVNAYNPAPQAGDAENKANARKDPDNNGAPLPRLVEVGAGKVEDNGKHKSARLPDDIAVDGQLVNVGVAYHGQRYAEVPQGADEKETGKKVVVFLPPPREDEKQHEAVQEEADERRYGGDRYSSGLHTSPILYRSSTYVKRRVISFGLFLEGGKGWGVIHSTSK
jgi:hypothetical protein